MFLTFLGLIAVALASILTYLGRTLIQIQHERDRLWQDLRRYESLASREETEKQLDSNINLKESELQDLELEQKNLINEIQKIKSNLRELEDKYYLISIDDYEPKYYYLSSGEYIQRLKDIKVKQKQMQKNKKAFICDTQWKVGEGKGAISQGDKTKKALLKMLEFAFEEQCKYAIKEVKYNNVDKLRKKIDRTFHQLNSWLKPIKCSISNEYFSLKFVELNLKYELEEKKQEEKEKEREIREKMQKEKKDRRKIEEVQQEAEEAEQRERQYQEEIERIRLEETKVVGLEKEKYERQIKQLEEQLAKAKTDKEKAEKAISYSRLKSGYIYVISNIGSLGRDVYRIIMTKNSDPDAYIRTMNPYVPFPFDIHYKIFSEDASATVQHLHQQFNDKRVNIENERREFFKVSFNEIEQFVQELDRKTGNLRIETSERVPHAYEYRRTQAAERRKSHDTTLSNAYIDKNEIA